jgi:hypothetical protein
LRRSRTEEQLAELEKQVAVADSHNDELKKRCEQLVRNDRLLRIQRLVRESKRRLRQAKPRLLLPRLLFHLRTKI